MPEFASGFVEKRGEFLHTRIGLRTGVRQTPMQPKYCPAHQGKAAAQKESIRNAYCGQTISRSRSSIPSAGTS